MQPTSCPHATGAESQMTNARSSSLTAPEKKACLRIGVE